MKRTKALPPKPAPLLPQSIDDFAAPQKPDPTWTDADMAKFFKNLLFRERRRHATCESVFARTVRDQDKTIAQLRQELFTLLAVTPKPSRNPNPKGGTR